MHAYSTDSEIKIPELQILSEEGHSDVATVYVARTENKLEHVVEFVNGVNKQPRREKWIVNISTQYGCPVKCTFCDASHYYSGNVTKHFMLAQIQHVLNQHPDMVSACEKLKVHFQRMGEPALNDDVPATIAELPKLIDNKAGLWACIATTAPHGRDAWFKALTQVKKELFHGRFQLQLSINSTSMEKRREIMPVKLMPFEKLAEMIDHFWEEGDRLVNLNFALADNWEFDADAIIKHFNPKNSTVKITPLNPTETGNEHGLGSAISRSTDRSDALVEQCDKLKNAGFGALFDIGDGREDVVGSNCGQSVRKTRNGILEESFKIDFVN